MGTRGGGGQGCGSKVETSLEAKVGETRLPTTARLEASNRSKAQVSDGRLKL